VIDELPKVGEITLELVIHRRTDHAYLVSDDGEEKNGKWLPRREVTCVRRPRSTIVDVTMPEWLAIDRGLV
jgi:hypothetical protein